MVTYEERKTFPQGGFPLMAIGLAALFGAARAFKGREYKNYNADEVALRPVKKPAPRVHKSDELATKKSLNRQFPSSAGHDMHSASGTSCGNCNAPMCPDWIACPVCGADSGKKCAKCGSPLERDWIACPSCGEEMPMLCEGCGATLEKSWIVCPSCGCPPTRRAG